MERPAETHIQRTPHFWDPTGPHPQQDSSSLPGGCTAQGRPQMAPSTLGDSAGAPAPLRCRLPGALQAVKVEACGQTPAP